MGAAALEQRGVPVIGSLRGYTRTHQVIADVKGFGGGLEVGQRLRPSPRRERREARIGVRLSGSRRSHRRRAPFGRGQAARSARAGAPPAARSLPRSTSTFPDSTSRRPTTAGAVQR